MGNQIDLGSFQWDTNKIENQIAANTLEMNRFAAQSKSAKDAIKEQSKAIAELEKKIDDERKYQEQLNRELNNGTISQEKYNVEMYQSNQLIDRYVDNQIEATRIQADHIIVQNRAQQATRELRLENGELNRLMAAGREELTQSEGAYRELNKELNALKTEAKNLGAEMVMLERAGQKDSDEYRELAARFAEVSQQADQLNDSFKEIDASVGDNQRNVGNYKEAITEAFSEITTGVNQMASGDVKGGFETMKAGFSGIKASAVSLFQALLANPLTALLAAFAAITTGIALGVKEIFAYNEAIKENQKLVENLTSTTGKAADEIRVRAGAIASTFGDEFNEVVKTANVLARQLGISYEEAFNQIENGYVRGANANGDFLERLSEYGPLLAKYGFDINEIIGLQVQAQKQGIFNDKFEDSLKEAGLSLEEFTKAQSDALTSAFGQEFSDKISKGINSGALSVKDALLIMGNEAKKQNLTVQQFGVLTADIFKGAGEDAGGAKKMFENLYSGLQRANNPLTELEKKTQDLSQANYELAKAKDDALKSDTVQSFQTSMELMWTKVQTIWYELVGAMTDAVRWFDEITGASEVLGETWETVKEFGTSLWDAVMDIVDVFGDLFEALGLNNDETKDLTKSFFNAINPLNLLKALFGVLTVAVKSFSSFVENSKTNITAFAITVKSVFGQIVDAAKAFIDLDFEGGLNKLKNINISKEFASARKEAERIAQLNKQQSSVSEKVTPEKVINSSKTQTEKDAEAKALADAEKKAEAERKKAETKRIADAKKSADDAQKALEAEAKRALDIARETANQQINIAKSELSEYIAINAEKYKNDKTLHQKKIQDQLAYFDEVKKLQTQANNAEESAKQFAIDQKIQEIQAKKVLNQNDLDEIKNLNLEKENISKEYHIKEIELTKSTEEQKATIQKNYDALVNEQKKLSQALSFQQRLLDLESRGASEFEIETERLNQETQLRLSKFWEENELMTEADQEKYDMNQEIAIGRAELESQIQLEKDEAEKERLQNQLSQLNLIESENAEKSKSISKSVDDFKLESRRQILSALVGLFGKESAVGKAFAIAEIANNTVMQATKAFQQGNVLASNPVTAALAINSYIQGGLIIATGAAQTAKLVAPKGFADGGLISGGVEISRSNGDNRLITAKDGEVILNEDQQNALGGASIFKMLGVPGFATGGVVGTPASSLSTVQNSIVNNNMEFEVMANVIREAVIEGAEIGTHNGSQSGISDLSTNRQIANGANF